MAPLTDADIAELDHWLQARIIRLARDSLPTDATEEDKRLTLEVALNQAAGMTWFSPTGARLMATVDGMARLTWQGIKTHHPDVTPDQIRALLLDPANIDEARVAFEQLNLPSGQSKKNDVRSAGPTRPREAAEDRRKRKKKRRLRE
jgi:hypothetical protein